MAIAACRRIERILPESEGLRAAGKTLRIAPKSKYDLVERMDCVLIRLAILSEREYLEALQLRASLTNAGDRDALLAHPDAITLPQEQIEAGLVYVAERNGAIDGFSAILPRPDGETELDALFVEPHSRRFGIGRSLVEYCAQIAKARGSNALHVIGNPHAMEFYTACGFKFVGAAEPPPPPGLLLRKQL